MDDLFALLVLVKFAMKQHETFPFWAGLDTAWESLRFRVWGRRSPVRQCMLLWILQLCVDKQLPLDRSLQAFAGDLDAPAAEQINAVARLIANGVSLPDALQQVPGTVSESSLLAIQVGSASGTLAETLREEARRLQRVAQHRGSSYVGIIAQFVALGLVAVGVLLFMGVYLVPKYKKIFADFGQPLPEITQSVWGTMHWLGSTALISMPAMLLLWWVAIAVALALDSRLTRGMRLFPALSSFPLIGKLHLRLEAAKTLRWLAIAVRRGRPLAALLETIHWHQRDPKMIGPLARAAEVMKQGGDCWDGLLAARLLNSREVALLQSAQRVGNLSWTLDEMSLRMERQVDDRCRIVFESLRPAVIGLAAIFVGVYVVSFFLPLVSLIHGMT